MTNRQAENCLRRFREGSETAFEELYCGLAKEVRMFSYTFVKDFALSEDIMQEVFIKFYREADAFRGDSSVKTYLFAITRNLSMNSLRKLRGDVGLDDLAEFRSRDNVESTVERRLEINRLLEGVSAMEKQIILLRAIGFKHKEIAKILSVPQGTVTWKYNDAVKKLRKEGEQ